MAVFYITLPLSMCMLRSLGHRQAVTAAAKSVPTDKVVGRLWYRPLIVDDLKTYFVFREMKGREEYLFFIRKTLYSPLMTILRGQYHKTFTAVNKYPMLSMTHPSFTQLGFSSNITLDTVTSTDLVEFFSFCTEFKSSWQKVWQLLKWCWHVFSLITTDLFSHRKVIITC